MSWSIDSSENLSLKIKAKTGLYHVLVSRGKKSPSQISLTVFELEHLPTISEIEDETLEISQLKWTFHNGRRKVFVEYRTDTKKIMLTRFCYRNNQWRYVEGIEMTLENYKSIIGKQMYVACYVDSFSKKCILLDESTNHFSPIA